jgi:hypothetical protein
MSVEDTFKGAKTGLTFLNAYIQTVGQVIGSEQAVALQTPMCEAMGAEQARMIKEQYGIKKFDLKTASQVFPSLMKEGYGIRSEVIEETPQMFRLKVGRCPVYEAAEELGMDPEAIEADCRASALKFMDAIARQLNPDLSYQLTKFRSASDDFCEEVIVLR